MPIPIIIGGAAILLGAAGIGGGIYGGKKIKQAKDIARRAQNRHKSATDRVSRKRNEVAEAAEKYGRYGHHVRRTTFKDIEELLGKLEKRVRLSSLRLPEGIDVSVSNIKDFRAKVLEPASDALGLVGAASTGAVAGSTTFALVGLLGTAALCSGLLRWKCFSVPCASGS